MKKLILSIAVVCTALVGCTKSSSGGEVDIYPDADENQAPQQIRFSTNLGSNQVATKGSVDKWSSQQVHIIGYDTTQIKTESSIAGFIIPDVVATAPASGDSGLVTFANPYYYEESVTYDFNGYYVDDATAGSVSIANGLMSLDVTMDGSQDILAGITDKNADRVIPDAYIEKYHYNPGAKVNLKYVYSSYAARRGVQPNLQFNHMLSKFTFKVQLGENEDTTIAQKINITKISVYAKPTGKLVLNPVENGVKVKPYITPVGDTTHLDIDMSSTPLHPGIHPNYNAVDSCLMVIPEGNEYQMSLSFNQDETDGKTRTLNFPVNIDKLTLKEGVEEQNAFEAGKHYCVNIIVYGLQEIKVSVKLIDWYEVGSFTYDPDKEIDDNDGIDEN